MADSSKKTAGGKAAIVVEMGKAARDIERQRKSREDPHPMIPRGPDKVLAGKWTPDLVTGMPSNPGCECPVVPIGFEGPYFYITDSRDQFRTLKAADFTQRGIQEWFSATPNYPDWLAPRWSKPVYDKKTDELVKPSEIVSFEVDDIAKLIFRACSVAGFFSPDNKMRGRGVWTTSDGNIIYHAGDALWTVRGETWERKKTGVYESKLYPRLATLAEPWQKPIPDADNPAVKLLQIFRKWNWTRPDVDPELLLGWIGCAMIGGALRWRSSVLLLGDRSTGKSTLQENLLRLFGDTLMQSSDPTAAFIYQSMAHDSRPVALDELEPDGDASVLRKMVHLMRTSSSGAIGGRGGQSGQATQFQMRSAFLFSAINNPLHAAQDMSRCAVLRLKPLNPDQTAPPPVDEITTGPMVLALMMKAWGDHGMSFKWELERFTKALKAGGHDRRGCDTYGTLLACAAMMLGHRLGSELGCAFGPDEERDWSERLAASLLPEVQNAKPNYRQCADRILTSVVRSWRNATHNTIGQAIYLTRTRDDDGKPIDPVALDAGTAKRDINMAGFGLFTTHEIVAGVMRRDKLSLEAALQRFGLPKGGWVLAVPNSSTKVAEHLEGSDWANGSWSDALRQCPIEGVIITDSEINRHTIDGTQTRCTLIVLNRYHAAPER